MLLTVCSKTTGADIFKEEGEVLSRIWDYQTVSWDDRINAKTSVSLAQTSFLYFSCNRRTRRITGRHHEMGQNQRLRHSDLSTKGHDTVHYRDCSKR